MTSTNHTGQPEDRLHREVDEILQQSRDRPISFQQRVAQKRHAVERQRHASTPALRQAATGARRLLLKVPIVTALALALVGAYLAPEYDILAYIFALAAIVMVFIPFAVRDKTSSPASQTQWRGRVVSNLPPVQREQPQSWIDRIKQRFDR